MVVGGGVAIFWALVCIALAPFFVAFGCTAVVTITVLTVLLLLLSCSRWDGSFFLQVVLVVMCHDDRVVKAFANPDCVRAVANPVTSFRYLLCGGVSVVFSFQCLPLFPVPHQINQTFECMCYWGVLNETSSDVCLLRGLHASLVSLTSGLSGSLTCFSSGSLNIICPIRISIVFSLL